MTLLAGLMLVASGCSSGSHPAATSPRTGTATTPGATATTAAPGSHSSGCVDDGRLGGLTTGWVQMVSATTGFAVLNHTIVGTVDGRHWNRLYTAPERLSYVDAVDANHAWAVGFQTVFTTTDAGRHWVPSPKSEVPLSMVHFIDADHGWGVHYGTLLQTSTAGRVWQAVPTPCPVDRVCFTDAQHGWLATHASVYTTSDGGSDWRSVLTVRDPAVAQDGVASDLQCTAGDDAWILFDGRNCGAGSCAYISYRCDATGGCVKFTGPASNPGPFSVIDDHTAVFVGFAGPVLNPMSVMFVRDDGRQRGPAMVVPDGDPAQASPQGVDFVSPTHGWIVDGALFESHILGTTDGGKTWTVQYSARLP